MAKIKRIWIIIAVAILVLTVSGCDTEPLELISAVVASGGNEAVIDLNNPGVTSTTEEAVLTLTFSTKLHPDDAKALPYSKLIVSGSTLLIPLAGMTEITIPASFAKINKHYRFEFSYPPIEAGGEFAVESASLVFMVGQSGGNQKWVTINPDDARAWPIFGEAWLSLGFTQSIDPTSLPKSFGSSYSHPSPQNLMIKLKNTSTEVVLPTTVSSEGGQSLLREYRFGFEYISNTPASATLISLYIKGYPQLKLDETGTFPVALGEAFVIKQNWPLEREGFEAKIKHAFARATITLEWLDDMTLAVTITAASKDQYDIDLSGIVDRYGYTHEPEVNYHVFPYTVQIVEASYINQFDTVTGQETTIRVPVSINGATSSAGNKNQVKLFRLYYVESEAEPYSVKQRFSLDLESGKVVGEVIDENAESAWYAQGLVRHYIPGDVVTSHASVSPSGKSAAVIYWSWQEQRSYLLVVDLLADKANTVLLTSRLESHGSGKPPDPILWSYDEGAIAYYSMSPQGIGGIHGFDLGTREESMLAEKQNAPLAISPDGQEVIYSRDNSYNVSRGNGNTQQIEMAGDVLFSALWSEPGRILITKHPKGDSKQLACYFYYLDEDRFELITTGQAFDYNTITGTVYVLERQK